jgi:hypothetical protein
METNQFTLIFFENGMYYVNRELLKEIISKYGLAWNVAKLRSRMSYTVMEDIYKVFKIEDLVIDSEIVKGRSGSSGIWESPTNAVKIIVFDKAEDENLELPVLMVYKGDESAFYKEFLLKCIEMGCEISKVIEKEDGEYEQIFRKKKNVKMMKLLNDELAIRQIIINNFCGRIKAMKRVGAVYSNDFIEGWVALISERGTYTDKMLIDNFCNNIENNNIEDDIENNNIEDDMENNIRNNKKGEKSD